MLATASTPRKIGNVGDEMAEQKHRKRAILVAVIVVAMGLCSVFGLANRHRALIRQPRLFVKCAWSQSRQPGSLGECWGRFCGAVDYFWYSYRVHIGKMGEWHTLPMYRPSEMRVEEEISTLDEVDIKIDFGAQPTNPVYRR